MKTAYKSLILRNEEAAIEEDKRTAVKRLWSTAVPSKFLVHAWRVLWSSLPTRVALQRDRRACFASRTMRRMSIFSSTATRQQINSWCGITHGTFIRQWDHFMQHMWIAVVWIIWINRNKIIFRRGSLM